MGYVSTSYQVRDNFVKRIMENYFSLSILPKNKFMKFRGPIFFSILAVGLLVAAYLPQEDSAEKEAVLIRTILNGLNQLHYKPITVNNEFSQKVYDQYLDQMDGNRRFLTARDVAILDTYKNQLDDEALGGTYEFFDQSLSLLNAGLEKTQGFYREILKQPFDFAVNEKIELDGEKRGFAENDEALNDYWRKYLKFETLTRVNDALEEEKEKGEEAQKKSFDDIEKEAREDVLEMFDRWYERMFKLKREDRLSFYLNTITSIYDPHTNYLKPIDKENFNIRFSGRLEGIGARLQTDGDFTKVVDVVVGGPAWKGKELEENDLILKVAQGKGDNKEDAVDIKGMVLDDVVQKIRGKKGTNVTLTVKKVDGTVKDIIITRDIVIMEERFAKSLIMEGEEGEKIGYLYLPSFYADFENRDGRFCAKDVAAELEKLKEQNVDGIIFDLRNNGGGSLRDVVKMSGFFIEEGPIVQVKSRGREPEVLMDVDDRVQYDGPLVVMVNQNSASASEILAAALQDYGRAVIVGSKSTFGKGTVQRFIDLDRTIRGFNDIKPLGEIKLTTQKFYRINGGSTQLKGVVPDIVLPDSYQYIKTGEKQEEYAMEWTEIKPVAFSQKVTSLDNLEAVKEMSAARVDGNPVFQKVLENAKRFKKQRDLSAYPINLEGYQAFETAQEEEAAKYKDIMKDVVNQNVKNLTVDLPALEADESKRERNKNWVESVSKDVYIKETLSIMHDLITIK